MSKVESVIDNALKGTRLGNTEALSLANYSAVAELVATAAMLRDIGHGSHISYSPAIALPLKQDSRRQVHRHATPAFAPTSKRLRKTFLAPTELLELAYIGLESGCCEAVFTLGGKPEQCDPGTKAELLQLGYPSALDYLTSTAQQVVRETGLLPHLIPGIVGRRDLQKLRSVSVLQTIMLANGSRRLCEKSWLHYGAREKNPIAGLGMIAAAGALCMPISSGLVIGQGETRLERIESLLALRDLDDAYGHVQEVIIQHAHSLSDSKKPPPLTTHLDELLWTIAVARILFGPTANIQTPANCSPQQLTQLVQAGINDWGSVAASSVDPAGNPMPHLQIISEASAAAGKQLTPRLAIYPEYVARLGHWVDKNLQSLVLKQADAKVTLHDGDQDFSTLVAVG